MEEAKQEEAKQEEAQEKPQQEEANEPSLSDVIKNIKNGYEEKIENIVSKYEKRLAEREKVIVELLNGDAPVERKTIADQINERRKFAKW